MRELTLKAVEDPMVRTFALSLWSRSGEDVRRFGSTVRSWVKGRVRFALEYPEQLHRPEWMLREILRGRRVYGDCDDMSMLTAALLLAMGIAVRFAAVKPAGDPDYIHVFTEMFDEGQWLMVDATADQIPPGTWDVLRQEV
jgi:transglutaminase-like putative cysteine protease